MLRKRIESFRGRLVGGGMAAVPSDRLPRDIDGKSQMAERRVRALVARKQVPA